MSATCWLLRSIEWFEKLKDNRFEKFLFFKQSSQETCQACAGGQVNTYAFWITQSGKTLSQEELCVAKLLPCHPQSQEAHKYFE